MRVPACTVCCTHTHTHKVIWTPCSVHGAYLFAFIQIRSKTQYTALSFYSRRSRASVFILFWIQFYFLMLKNSLTHLTHIRPATQWECLECLHHAINSNYEQIIFKSWNSIEKVFFGPFGTVDHQKKIYNWSIHSTLASLLVLLKRTHRITSVGIVVPQKHALTYKRMGSVRKCARVCSVVVNFLCRYRCLSSATKIKQQMHNYSFAV